MDTAGAIQDAHSGLHAADADARSRCDAGCNGASTQDAHRRCGAERAQPRTAPHTPAAPLRLRGGAARRGRARGCGSRCWRRRRRGGLRPCPAHGPAPGAPRGPALLRGAEHGAAAGAAAGRAPAAARRPPQQEGRAGPGCGAMRCDAVRWALRTAHRPAPQFQALQREREERLAANSALARDNLALRPRLEDGKAALAIKYQELREVREACRAKLRRLGECGATGTCGASRRGERPSCREGGPREGRGWGVPGSAALSPHRGVPGRVRPAARPGPAPSRAGRVRSGGGGERV